MANRSSRSPSRSRNAWNSRARAEPCRHSLRNPANSSFRNRSFSALTRSYSTNGAPRSASISAQISGRLSQSERPAVARVVLHAFNVEVEEVLVEGRIRKIRAGIEGAPIVYGVQRVERHEAGAEIFRDPVHHLEQVAKIAAAPIAGRAQSVEAHGHARRPAAAAQVGVRPCPVRRHDVARRRTGGAQLHGYIVIAQRQADGQARLFPHPGAAIHLDVGGLRKLPEVPLELGDRTVLATDRNPGAESQRFRRHVENQLRLGRFAGDHRRRQQPLPLPARDAASECSSSSRLSAANPRPRRMACLVSVVVVWYWPQMSQKPGSIPNAAAARSRSCSNVSGMKKKGNFDSTGGYPLRARATAGISWLRRAVPQLPDQARKEPQQQEKFRLGNHGRLRHMIPQKLHRSAVARIPSIPGGPVLLDLRFQDFGELACSNLLVYVGSQFRHPKLREFVLMFAIPVSPGRS